MDDMMIYILAFLVVLNIILIVSIIKLKRKYEHFIKTSGQVNIEEILLKNQDQIANLEKFKEYFDEYEKRSKKKMKQCISRVAIKKYNAFEGMGGELSALICMLDEHGDGVLINVVHTGELNHVFTKEIIKGECKNALSTDEKALLASM